MVIGFALLVRLLYAIVGSPDGFLDALLKMAIRLAFFLWAFALLCFAARMFWCSVTDAPPTPIGRREEVPRTIVDRVSGVIVGIALLLGSATIFAAWWLRAGPWQGYPY